MSTKLMWCRRLRGRRWSLHERRIVDEAGDHGDRGGHEPTHERVKGEDPPDCLAPDEAGAVPQRRDEQESDREVTEHRVRRVAERAKASGGAHG